MVILAYLLIGVVAFELVLLVILALAVLLLRRWQRSVDAAHVRFEQLPAEIKAATKMGVGITSQVLQTYVQAKLFFPWWLSMLLMAGKGVTQLRLKAAPDWSVAD